MIEMMLDCIPETPTGDEIRAQLLEQYKQVTAPTDAGGVVTYTHTYGPSQLRCIRYSGWYNDKCYRGALLVIFAEYALWLTLPYLVHEFTHWHAFELILVGL